MHSILKKFILFIALLMVGCGGGSSDASLPDNEPSPGNYDTDGDGVMDENDDDDDNDGISDDEDPFPRSVFKNGVITADFFTRSPEAILGPVKVLFAIDCSGSMMGSDPPDESEAPFGRRISAVRQFIDLYNTSQYPSLSFGVVLWSGDIVDQTCNIDGEPGFTRSGTELNRVLNAANAFGSSDYLQALNQVRTMVQNDIERVVSESGGGHTLARSTYIICLLSDGPPQTDQGVQSDADIWQEVTDLAGFARDHGAGKIHFNTFFLSASFRDESGNEIAEPALVADRNRTRDILLGMSQRCDGTFYEFASAADIDFITHTDLQTTTEYSIKFIVAYNYMVRPVKDMLGPDSDGDGLTDDEEASRGTDPQDVDTDNDGLSDGLEANGDPSEPGAPWPYDPLLPDSNCTPPSDGLWPDQDGDGLNGCEESVVKTLARFGDLDMDAIPDGIEIAAGTDPLEDLIMVDTDLDGAIDRTELQRHTNVLFDDPTLRSRFGYFYDLSLDHSPHPDQPAGSERYYINISNINLINTQGAAAGSLFNDGQAMLPGDNVIRLYIAQVPDDRSSMPAVFSMAEVIVNYYDEDLRIVLEPSDFKMLP